MSYKLVDACLYLPWPTAAEKLVLVALASFADDYGKGIYPSVSRIAFITGYSSRNVRRTLGALRDKGALKAVSNTFGGARETVHYEIDAAEFYRVAKNVQDAKAWTLVDR